MLHSSPVLSAATLLGSFLAFGSIAASDPADGAAPGPPRIAAPRVPRQQPWHLGALPSARETGHAPGDRPFSPASVIHPGTLKVAGDPGVPGRLLFLIQSEALRYRRMRSTVTLEPLEPTDSWVEEERARQAERIVTRAFNRTVDERLEHLARTSLGLSGLLEWVDDLGGIRLGPPAAPSGDGESPQGGPAGAPRSGDAGSFRASLALKLDAHPRLVLRAEFLGIRGRIEAAAPGEPIRLNFERPLGPRSRAALRGDLARDGSDWATFTFNFCF